jgi:cyanophycinase
MKKAIVIIWLSLTLSCGYDAVAQRPAINHGHVILCNEEVPDQKIIARLLQLAGSSRTLTILNLAPDDSNGRQLAQGLKTNFEKFNPGLNVVEVNWPLTGPHATLGAHATTRAMWIVSSVPVASTVNTQKLRDYLKSFQAKGGVIGISGAATALITDGVLKPRPATVAAANTQPSTAFRKLEFNNAEGLGLLKAIVVERNSIKRSRLNYLVGLVLNQPQRTIVGLDESGAVWIKPNGDLEVIGSANVMILSAARAHIDIGEKPSSEAPYLTAENVQLNLLLPGGIYSLPAGKVKRTGEAEVRGHLIMMGGGSGFPADALDKFLQLTGSPNELIVVFSIGMEEKERRRQEFQAIKSIFTNKSHQNVEAIYLDDPNEARDDKLVQMVLRAKGIIFGGGDQRRFTKLLQGTPLEQALWKIYSDGAVFAGSSAGTAIQGRWMITGDAKTVAEDKELPSPFHTIRLGNVEATSGMGFFPGAIVDQHFLARTRGNRLLSTILEHPNVIGVGIDAGAAVWLKPDHTFQVMGNSSVMVVDPSNAQVRAGMPLDAAGQRTVAAGNLNVAVLGPGYGFDLNTRRIIKPPLIPTKAIFPQKRKVARLGRRQSIPLRLGAVASKTP